MQLSDFQYNTPVVGGQFQKGFKWDEVKPGTDVHIVPEPKNPHDRNALAVHIYIRGESHRIGYIPKEFAKILAPPIHQGTMAIQGMLTWVAGSRNLRMHYNLLAREPESAEADAEVPVHR